MESSDHKEIKLLTGTLLIVPIDNTTFDIRLARTTAGKKDHICYRIVPEEFVYITDQRGELVDEGYELIGTKKEIDDLKNFEKYEEILTPILVQYKAWEEHCWDVGDVTYFCAIAVLRGLINNDSDNYVVLLKKK